MSRVMVDYFSLEQLRKSPIIGYGRESICYEYDKDYVLKLFNYLLDERRIYFEGVKASNIAFPIDIYEYKKTGLIQGILLRKLLGTNLQNGFKSDLEIEKLITAYNKGRQELALFPDIKIDDITGKNILFDEKNDNFNFIDTTSWVPNDDSIAVNLKKLDDIIMQSFCCKNLAWQEQPLINNPQILKIYDRWINHYDEEDNEIFPEFLLELENITEQEKGKVKTIGELKRK